ncbi:unnamed protein product [Linum trigynum]|uniref:Ubiquitin-like protease family profile domain-containing protein n=1 Tax=Linum trigynum TaxID=586398 RepID=A0AAV2D909_9ROSI
MIEKSEEHDRCKVVDSRSRPLENTVEEVLEQLKTEVVEDQVENPEAKMEMDEQPLEKDQVEPQVEKTGEMCEEDPEEKNRFEVVENEAEKTVETPVEEVFEPTVPMVIHYTDPNTTFEDIMQIAHEATTAANAEEEDPPTREEVLETTTHDVVEPFSQLAEMGMLPTDEELVEAACNSAERSPDVIITHETTMNEEEQERMYNYTPEEWLATLKTPAFESSKKNPYASSSIYYLSKDVSTKLDPVSRRMVEFVFSTPEGKGLVVHTPSIKLARLHLLTLKRLEWVNIQVVEAYGHFLNDKALAPDKNRVIFPFTFGQLAILNSQTSVPSSKERLDVVVEVTQRVLVFKRVAWDKLEYIFPPVHTDHHYRVYAAELRSQKTFLLDSIKPKPAVAKVDHSPVGKLILEYGAPFLAKHNINAPLHDWEFLIADVPQQKGNDDCGVFACMFMEHWEGHIPSEYKETWHLAKHVEHQGASIAGSLLQWKYNKVRNVILEEANEWEKDKEKGKSS